MPVGTDTTESTRLGKAYEFACLNALFSIVSPIRPVSVKKDSSFTIAQQRFSEITALDQRNMIASATAGMKKLLDLEPSITCGTDFLVLSLQPDSVAKTAGGADVRDLIITRPDINWEIGISIKHNHQALKHSRLSNKLDFGKQWYDKPCSRTYFDEIKPIFSSLTALKAQGKLWADMADKANTVYKPLLNAFKKELIRENNAGNITKALVQYLIGCNGLDYYKLVHHNDNNVDLTPYNITGVLNKADPSGVKPKILLPDRMILPTRIESFNYKIDRNQTVSDNTLILKLNENWTISFRIHNASSKVEPSLKFDIQLASHPISLICFTSRW